MTQLLLDVLDRKGVLDLVADDLRAALDRAGGRAPRGLAVRRGEDWLPGEGGVGGAEERRITARDLALVATGPPPAAR